MGEKLKEKNEEGRKFTTELKRSLHGVTRRKNFTPRRGGAKVAKRIGKNFTTNHTNQHEQFGSDSHHPICLNAAKCLDKSKGDSHFLLSK